MRSGFYITTAYWFTASIAFADSAMTVARAVSDTFSEIDRRPLLRLSLWLNGPALTTQRFANRRLFARTLRR
jgi:hypothetical protein